MRKKIVFLLSILILVALSIVYLNLSPNDPTEQVHDASGNDENKEPIDEQVEIQDEQIAEDQESNNTITEEITEKVKQVVGNTVELFLKDDLKMVAIGDSLTQGVGDETDNGGYVGILNHTFERSDQKIEIENFGKRGNRSDQLLARLEQQEIVESIEDANIVLLTIGANDIMKVVKDNFTNLREEPFNQEKVAYIERLRAIFDKIFAINPEVEVFLVGFYNPFEKYFSNIEQLGIILDGWNTAGRNVTNQYDQASFIPTDDLFQSVDKNLFADDNFHPNADGYQLIAERVLTYLRPYIMKESEE
ncbi:SGNH/GDSL hydrolase family protein [Aquibacillus sediminis]|uniref:SGNH/GDSL hydrolase family protein n=1 Tax=Aquibacillus sediminis TaxID=2574734 RepID=UPI001FE26ECD|nr:SGNH/GDSL hydrolase family protein [Aquibacillus sediminis]